MRTWAQCERCSDRKSCAEGVLKGRCPNCGGVVALPNGFDVFVSYSSVDREIAQRISSTLHSRRINYWLDQERIKSLLEKHLLMR